MMMTMPGMDNLMMPNMDPALGRKLFASKGCVAGHAINGVGGHDATALDAHTMDAMMNPLRFRRQDVDHGALHDRRPGGGAGRSDSVHR